jgi:hypothetical protein
MVLMDGSETCFKAVTNSGLAMLLHGGGLCAGCTLVIKDFTWLWFDSGRHADWKAIMLIKNMGWNYPPGFNLESQHCTPPPAKKAKQVSELIVQDDEDATQDEDNPSHKTFRGHRFCVDKVEKQGIFVFTHVLIHKPERYRWNHQCVYQVCGIALKEGDWIHLQETRCDWMDFIKPLMKADKEDDEAEPPSSGAVLICDSQDSRIPIRECECMTKFGMLGCVLYAYPVESIPKDELFATCRHHLLSKNIKTYGRKFGALSPNHKRWCLYTANQYIQ